MRDWNRDQAGRDAMAELCQKELANQRLHPFPVAEPRLWRDPDLYTTTASRAYSAGAAATEAGSVSFTVGFKNDIGTKNKSMKVPLETLRARNELRQSTAIATPPVSSTAADAFQSPSNMAEVKVGGGQARLPASEVGRRFYSTTSDGLLPGGLGGAANSPQSRAHSEQQAQFTAKPPVPREPVRVTVRRQNDLGTRESTAVVPPKSLLRTNYQLGTDTVVFSSTTQRATPPPPTPHARRAGPDAAGRAGASEIALNSADYNIISGGPALGQTEALRRERNRLAFERPVGLKQHPSNPPRDTTHINVVTGARRVLEN